MRKAHSSSALLISAAPGHAAPLPYDELWQVTFNTAVMADARRAFGEAAAADGDLFGLAADTAVCRAESISAVGILVADNTAASLSFSREFTLPQGSVYRLTLRARLQGEMSVRDTNDMASVDASAAIGPVGAPAFLLIDDTDHTHFARTIVNEENFSTPTDTGDQSESTPGFTVLPGTYEVRGTLGTVTSTPNGFGANPDAKSNFFNDSTFGFRVSAEFEALPEVPTLSSGALISLCLAIGLVGLAAAKHRGSE